MRFGHADPKLLPERLCSTVGVPVPLCALQSAPKSGLEGHPAAA